MRVIAIFMLIPLAACSMDTELKGPPQFCEAIEGDDAFIMDPSLPDTVASVEMNGKITVLFVDPLSGLKRVVTSDQEPLYACRPATPEDYK